jgi:hypothetical protein
VTVVVGGDTSIVECPKEHIPLGDDALDRPLEVGCSQVPLVGLLDAARSE